MPNPQTTQQGIDTRNTIVALLELDREEGGDGLTRSELAVQLDIAKPTVQKHVLVLFEQGRIKEGKGRRLAPDNAEHVHVCRTCGKSFHA